MDRILPTPLAERARAHIVRANHDVFNSINYLKSFGTALFLAIAGDQIKQDPQPLLGCKASIEVAIRSLGLGVAIELADDRLH